MVSILHTENAKTRTFGWVQNPSNFRSLCNVVAVFDQSSTMHNELRNKIIPDLVSLENGQAGLIAALDTRPLKISYSHLVGTGKAERKAAPCDAIIQAAVPGQGCKRFTDNWTADGFVRWAHCLGFIKYNYVDDTFVITETGKILSAAYAADEQINNEERIVLEEAMLSYPPAIRVLALLAEENAHLTKFEIGKQLGFVGEGGFTSMPQSVFVRSLSATASNEERKYMRANWEGSSDKYARMIATWLIKLGLVKRVSKNVTVSLNADSYTESIGQAYVITAQGLTALRRTRGASKHTRTAKTICYEMLATKGIAGSDREYLRVRRGLIIKELSERKGSISVSEIMSSLKANDIVASKKVIFDDVQGFRNIGLDIDTDGDNFTWRDKINDFVIPVRAEAALSDGEQIKDELRESITHLPHEYLSLIDLAYDSSQNRLFEMKTLQLLTEECRFEGVHLGGSRKPDGVAFTTELADNYGIIIDTKAYSKGYSLSIAQADEMMRYVQENQRRNERENPNKWWNNFAHELSHFYFMFVSGHFKGKYQEQIDRISLITSTKGSAIEVYDLLLIAESIKDKSYSLGDAEDVLFGE
ncbi:MAG: hypothetical protein FWH17_03200 [Oscillospiraceae bacterium]|nr:hypothetical protein [Oscillospiraceae bacterium]